MIFRVLEMKYLKTLISMKQKIYFIRSFFYNLYNLFIFTIKIWEFHKS